MALAHDDEKRNVTVFGAGISGLTVAHELAIRGFNVEVIDPDIREEVHAKAYDRGIGGMARSQWACFLRGTERKTSLVDHAPDAIELESADRFLLNDVIKIGKDGKANDPPLFADMVDRAANLIVRLTKEPDAKGLTFLPYFQIFLPTRDPKNLDVTKDQRAVTMKAALKSHPALASKPELVDEIAVRPIDATDIQFEGHVLPGDDWLFFNLPDLQIFAAEHGFRFFPSFYRHLFDTMRRTPVAQASPFERLTATVADNLLPSEGLGFARDGATKSFFVPRRKIESTEELLTYLRKVYTELDYDSEDNERYWRKLLEFMTSSTRRRHKEYEHLSWAEFVDIDRFSEVCKKHVEFGPQMSAALRGSQSDVRTQGNITTQLVLDQMKQNARPDCTLSGPTSTAWLNHWHDFLLLNKVTFRRGALVGFDKNDNGELTPTVVRTPGKDAIPVITNGHYLVFALSLPAAVDVAHMLIEAEPNLAKGTNDAKRTIAFALATPPERLPEAPQEALGRQVNTAIPKGPLQHLSGIQFYFDVPIGFWRGHTQYLDAKWGLTSIAQTQFWRRPRLEYVDPYRGILSVDIGSWDGEHVFDDRTTRTPWESTSGQVATGCWAQIVDHHDDAFRARYGNNRNLPTPIAYSIDTNLTFKTAGGIAQDRTPFLVNRVSAYASRPGALPPADGKTSKQISHYELVLGRCVFAGTFMKTFTRLTSMEGANESARHAVNAIIQNAGIDCENCEIWDPEDNEIADFDWLRELDEKRVDMNLPHIFKTLEALTGGI